MIYILYKSHVQHTLRDLCDFYVIINFIFNHHFGCFRTSDNNDVIILSDSGDEDDLNFWNISESNKKKKIEVGGDDSDDLSHLLEIEEDNDAMLNVPVS